MKSSVPGVAGFRKIKRQVSSPSSLNDIVSEEHNKVFEFREFLKEPFLVGGYAKFLAKTFCEEPLYCYKAIVAFEQNFDSISPAERYEYALHLYIEFHTNYSKGRHFISLNSFFSMTQRWQ